MTTRCRACEQRVDLCLYAKDFNWRTSDETFTYYQCPACGLVFLWPIPSDLSKYYLPGYYAIPSSLAQLAAVAEIEHYKIELIQRFVGSGRLLDIGPAYGSFAYLAKRAGFHVEAIEMDARCCQFLTEVVGVLAINNIDIPVALAGCKPYDVIALWHVIEHLPDSWLSLEVAAERLLSGGILVVATPNPEAFQFRVFRSCWAHLDAPRHLQLIPAALLVRQMRALGLRPVLLTTTDNGSIGLNSFGWAVSLRNFFRQQLARSVAHLVGRVLNKALIPLERSGWRGSAYTAVFQKS